MTEQWIAIVAGAVAGAASAPHCFAMCGPLALFAVSGGARGGAAGRVARYQLGRLASYATLGAVAGSSGGALSATLAPRASAIALALLVAAAMLFAAYRLLWPQGPTGLVPLRRERGRPSLASRVLSYAPREPAWIGVVSALLPCGALYTAVILAAGAGNALGGAATMSAFAVASGLALLASAAIGQRVLGSRVGRRVLAGVLIAGALMALARPLRSDARAGCHDDPVAVSSLDRG